MGKKILIVLSEWGYRGEELVGPLETFDQAGYQVDFATPTGKRAVALPPSMDANYVDPRLGRSVTSPEVAQKVRDLEASDRLDSPRSTPDSYLTGQKMVEVLETGLRRRGFHTEDN